MVYPSLRRRGLELPEGFESVITKPDIMYKSNLTIAVVGKHHLLKE